MEKIEKDSIQLGEVTSYGSEGEGIIKINGFPIFAPYGVVGDVVKVKILKSKKTFAIGEIIEIIKKSESRINEEDVCPYFKKCGGCSIANIKYIDQLEYKRDKVQQTLKKIGNVKDIEIPMTLGMEEPFFYRNKAQFPIDKINGKIVIGFYEKKSHIIVPIENCVICNAKINFVRQKVQEVFNEIEYSVYDDKTKKGLLKKLVVKTSYYSSEIMIIIAINGKKLPNEEQLIDRLKNIDGLTSVYINNNLSNKGNLSEESYLIYGENYITDSILDCKFQLYPLAFYQINPIQTEKLYGKVLEFLKLKGNETIIDCYCGIGTISLLLARKAKKVIGIEIVEEAIVSANNNSKLNNITNTEFFAGEAEVILKKIIEKNSVDAVVVDPPRKGLDELVVNEIIASKIKRIVYVSCDCATLARDLKKFCEGGYKVEKVQPVDMFCQGHHVETCVLLSHKNS